MVSGAAAQGVRRTISESCGQVARQKTPRSVRHRAQVEPASADPERGRLSGRLAPQEPMSKIPELFGFYGVLKGIKP